MRTEPGQTGLFEVSQELGILSPPPLFNAKSSHSIICLSSFV